MNCLVTRTALLSRLTCFVDTASVTQGMTSGGMREDKVEAGRLNFLVWIQKTIFQRPKGGEEGRGEGGSHFTGGKEYGVGKNHRNFNKK